MQNVRERRFGNGENEEGTFSAWHIFQAETTKIGPFPIECRINDNEYKLELPPELNMSSTFNISDLYEYHPPDEQQTTHLELETSSSEPEGS